MYGTKDLPKLIGRIPSRIQQDDEEIRIEFEDGATAVFYHSQDCCETVVVDDVNGDWADLIGTPLLVADERVSEETLDGCEPGDESNTWTFYTFRSVRGSVDVRWHGSSNGYYSEYVDLNFSEAH